MPLAFVLVNVEIGSECEVLEALKKVTYKIRRLDKVQSTQTMMVYGEAPP